MKTTKTLRFPSELAARLERHARLQRRSMTAVVEQALDKFLAVAEEGASGGNREWGAPVPPAPSSATAENGSNGEIDLAQWLSARTGTPRALWGRYLCAGRVTVDGEVFRGSTIAAGSLGQVRLDGEVV